VRERGELMSMNWPAMVGVLTADQAEIEEGSIWRMLDSIDPSGMKCIVILRNVTPGTQAQVEQHAAVLIAISTEPCGISKARNSALRWLRVHEAPEHLVVCFPDDDGYYTENIPEDVLGLMHGRDLVLGTYGEQSLRGEQLLPEPLTVRKAYVKANSVGIFIRWGLLERIGGFDENLGVGSGYIDAGEDLDLVVTALMANARNAAYCPAIQVIHPVVTSVRPERAGAHVIVARRNVRHPDSARVLVRSVVASLLGLSHISRHRLRFCLRPLSRADMRADV